MSNRCVSRSVRVREVRVPWMTTLRAEHHYEDAPSWTTALQLA